MGEKERKQYTARLLEAYLGAIRHMRWSYFAKLVNDSRPFTI